MNYVASGPLVLLTASAWFLAWVLAFHGVGAAIVGPSVTRFELGGTLLHKTLSIALGAFLFSVWTFACGSLGFLKAPALLVFFAAGLTLMILDKRKHFASEIRVTLKAWREAVWSTKILLGALFMLAVLSFIAAQAPETGNDSLWYHLYLPKTFVEAGRIFYDDNHPRSLWPSMMGMLFSAGLVFQGVALAKLFSWLMMALGIAAVPSAVLYFTEDKTAAKYSALFMGLIPALWMQSLYAYTDTAMMLYTFLAFAALWMCKEGGFDARQAVVAGLMLAALASIKFFTLIPAALMVLMYAAAYFFTPGAAGKKIKAVGITVGIVLVFSGFWFLRSYMLAGNPVFPFAAKWFGGHGFDQRMVGFVSSETGKGALDLLSVLWKTAMDVDTFGGEPIGCLFAAAIPALLFSDKLRGFASGTLMFSGAFIVAWFFSIQHIRFFFPALPFLAFTFAVLGREALREGTFLKSGLLGGLTLLAALQFSLCAYYPARILRAAIGEDAAQYLRENERSYSFMETIAPLLEGERKILFLEEYRMFYSPKPSVYLNGHLYSQIQDFKVWCAKNAITDIVTVGNGDSLKSPKDVPGVGQALHFNPEPVAVKTVRAEGRVFTYALWRTTAC